MKGTGAEDKRRAGAQGSERYCAGKQQPDDLKVGGSFVVIHPGGVDIVGLKINLNSGGSG